MKQFYYQPIGISSPTIEKVFYGSDGRLWAGENHLSLPKEGNPNEEMTSFGKAPDQIFPEEGDIVLLDPKGMGTILYEPKAPDNVLLITEKCNSRCLICPQPPKDDKDDLIESSLRILSLLDRETKVIGITGGEPTIVWEGLMKIVATIRENLPETSIQLLTNGRAFKSFAKADELRKIAGEMIGIGIPIYGDYDQLHDLHMGVKGAFWETIEGVFNLERVGLWVEIRTVITRLNFFRLAEWAEFIYRTFPFAGHVALMGLEPTGQALENIETVWIDPVDYVPDLEKAAKSLNRRGMEISIYNHQLCSLPVELSTYHRKSISGWKVRYLPECDQCLIKSKCGGFFHSAEVYRSKGISPITSNNNI
jgi:His-Xaa-Ser system radical SAM maturase HxsC